MHPEETPLLASAAFGYRTYHFGTAAPRGAAEDRIGLCVFLHSRLDQCPTFSMLQIPTTLNTSEVEYFSCFLWRFLNYQQQLSQEIEFDGL